MSFARLDTERMPKFVLKAIDFRVPLMNELYLNKNGKICRCLDTRQFSRCAQSKYIFVEEGWKNAAYISNLPRE